jgi:hypothetical protein
MRLELSCSPSRKINSVPQHSIQVLMTNYLIPIFVFSSVIIGAIAAFSLGRSYFGKLDRRRITENVIENGGEVLRIVRHSPPKLANRSDNVYDVAYKTRAGKRISAMCMTSISSGVVWISDKPPQDGIEISDEPVPTESISCLQCTAKIAPQATNCPQCGWSYQEK